MTIPSPLLETLEKYQLDCGVHHKEIQREGAASGEFTTQLLSEFLPWGENGCVVLATTGIVELEYAALIKSTALFDAACRGTIELTGSDKLDCINRLSTQQLLDMKTGESRLAFITSRKGSILADVIVHVLADKIIIDVDVTAVEQLCDHLNSYIVMENVEVRNTTDTMHWLWCLGPESDLIQSEEGTIFRLPNEFLKIKGSAILLTNDEVVPVWNAFVEQGVRPIGWYALNMARVEQGAPVFMIDFDIQNLPHETSLISSRVRFDKGCYLGQEIVARMESLGQPKKRIVKLQMKSDDLPIAATQLWKDKSATETPVGVVTSSAISPLCGGVPAVLAMVNKQYAGSNTTIYMYVGSELVPAVTEELTPAIQEESP